MSSEGSVTHWLTRMQAGDPAAVQHLWERYFSLLVQWARKKLQGRPGRLADEEDVALSAFDSFCRGVERGRFPQLLGRDNLWGLLLTITTRKVQVLVRHEGRQKRGGPVSANQTQQFSATEPSLNEIVGREPTPEFAAQMAEECQRLFTRLGDQELQTIALLKMEGYTNDEIASQLHYVPRTIERKIQLIRQKWTKEIAS